FFGKGCFTYWHMDNVCFVKSVLDLTSLDILDRFCYVHGYRSGFRIRHQALRSKYTSETSNDSHHVRGSYYYVELEPVLVLDLRSQPISAYIVCSSCLCFLTFCTFCKYKDTHLLPSAVRQYNCPPDLLITVTSVTSGSDMSLDRLIKFSYCGLLYK